MPSEIGYALPPINQRPQQFSRVEATDQNTALKVNDDESLQRTGVEQPKVKVVEETREVLDDRFPRETQVDRFRGNTEGRALSDVSVGASITRLPDQVQAFNPLTARSGDVSSLSVAESAALGLTQPAASAVDETIGASAAVGEATTDNQAQAQEVTSEVEFPSINGSGEIAARFEEIAERNAQSSNDEFADLRPGGPAAELIADERIQDQARDDRAAREQSASNQSEEFTRVVRRQDQARQDEFIAEDRSNQNFIDAQATNTNVQTEPVNQTGTNTEQEQNNTGNRSTQARQPGEPTNSSGEPLSSEEQKEIERLERRDREVRSHEQAHARVGGAHVRGGVQLSYETGPDGERYAVDGEVNIDLSPAATPQQTASKMRQVRSAALAPANPSGADRAVASLAARRELDARAQAAEADGDGRQDIAKAQISGEKSVSARETEEARQTELRESADHIAGAQSVIPDPSFSPRSSGVDQQSLQAAYGSSYPLSAPPSTSRPVSAPTPGLNIEETPEPPASPREEGESTRYPEVAELAVERGWRG